MGRSISLIYFYLISAIALMMIVIGVFSIVNFVINSTQYDKYPLGYEENCDAFALDTSRIPPGTPPQPTISPDERDRQKEQCEKRHENERKRRKIQDLKDVITFPMVGIILFLIHFPHARKLSEEKSK